MSTDFSVIGKPARMRPISQQGRMVEIDYPDQISMISWCYYMKKVIEAPQILR